MPLFRPPLVLPPNAVATRKHVMPLLDDAEGMVDGYQPDAKMPRYTELGKKSKYQGYLDY